MSLLDPQTLHKYQSLLLKDPSSQVFAPLAEAYRNLKRLPEAREIAVKGLQKNPRFVSGLVVLAKIHRDMGKFTESLAVLERVIELTQENILAYQLLGEVHLLLKNPQEALKYFKMVLFLNPNSEVAQKALLKLESLSATEFDDELFEMLPLNTLDPQKEVAGPPLSPSIGAPSSSEPSSSTPKELLRVLSLIDAFISRNDLEKAQHLLLDCKKEFGNHSSLDKRFKTLNIHLGKLTIPTDSNPPTPIKPLESRGELLRQMQIADLELLLRKIEEYRSQVDGAPSRDL